MPDVTPTTKSLTDVIAKLRRALRTSIRTDYSWETLPMAQVELMQTLAERGQISVGELAVVMLLAPNTASNLVRQGVDAGRVERVKHPDDKRIALVTLTGAGSAQLDEWMNAHELRLADALGQLSATDRTDISRAIGALDRLTLQLNQSKDRQAN